jgi:hypothetical protein
MPSVSPAPALNAALGQVKSDRLTIGPQVTLDRVQARQRLVQRRALENVGASHAEFRPRAPGESLYVIGDERLQV